jgi:hypothetical protein
MGTGKRFAVALSFPGERRGYVAEVARHLAERLGRERVLYDQWHEAEFARPDLDTYLQTLYHDQSALIAVFLCADYERKDWCGGVEWRAVKDLIKRREGAAIMPLRFDTTEIPGLFSTDGYVWLGDHRDPAEVAALILQRWQLNGGKLPAEPEPEPDPQPTPRVDISKLPAGAEHFLGRAPELAALDTARDQRTPTAIVEIIAPGGTGKTALVKRWLAALGRTGWHGATQVFGWSFYSQGSGDDRQASEDLFLAKAIEWLGVDIAASAHPADKGQAIAEHLCTRPTLLILDGCEPLQYPPGPMAGELRAPGLKAMLTHLATAGPPGLCVVTSREWLQDLAEWVRGDACPHGTVLRLDLGNLSDQDGARLLHARGADHAGAAAIGPDDPELLAASREVQGHALTLSLLGGYLALAHAGDIRRRDQVRLQDADRHTRAGRVFPIMAAYETWLAAAGADAARELAALRLLGFFDRPVQPALLDALRAAPPIPGLTDALFTPAPGRAGVSPAGRAGVPAGTTAAAGRVGVSPTPGVSPAKPRTPALAHPHPPPSPRRPRAGRQPAPPSHARPGAHPRHRLAHRPQAPGARRPHRPARAGRQPRRPPAGARIPGRRARRALPGRLARGPPPALRAAQGLRPAPPGRPRRAPAPLPGRRPRLPGGAVARGLRRGLSRPHPARHRADGFYSTKKLGAFGADLGAVACFFSEPWRRPAPALSAPDRAWLLNEAAFRLRALGRLAEALEPMRAGAEMAVEQEDWKNAAIGYGNLSELQLALGRIDDALADARRAVAHADRSGDAFQRMAMRTTLADALHQQGDTAAARAAFAEAEAMQAEWQPAYPLLYSLRGFRTATCCWPGPSGPPGPGRPRPVTRPPPRPPGSRWRPVPRWRGGRGRR